MCQKDVVPEERVEGAETLAYLTEVDTELQRIASISDHLIPTLSELLKFRPPNQNGGEPMDDNDTSKNDYTKVSVRSTYYFLIQFIFIKTSSHSYF